MLQIYHIVHRYQICQKNYYDISNNIISISGICKIGNFDVGSKLTDLTNKCTAITYFDDGGIDTMTLSCNTLKLIDVDDVGLAITNLQTSNQFVTYSLDGFFYGNFHTAIFGGLYIENGLFSDSLTVTGLMSLK